MFKNLLHMHFMAWLIPMGAIVTYVNVTIGPATLEPIPEGYVPKEHEYHRHPIARFFAGWVYPSYQECYEVQLHQHWQLVSYTCEQTFLNVTYYCFRNILCCLFSGIDPLR